MRVQVNGRKWQDVGSIAEAQAVIMAKVAGRVSGDGWYRGLGTLRGAAVTDDTGAVVARISYNGRAWTDADYGTPEHHEIVVDAIDERRRAKGLPVYDNDGCIVR